MLVELLHRRGRRLLPLLPPLLRLPTRRGRHSLLVRVLFHPPPVLHLRPLRQRRAVDCSVYPTGHGVQAGPSFSWVVRSSFEG